MKVSSSIRSLYDHQEGINRSLSDHVKELFEGAKKENWFYKGRIKQLESFAQKLETGRFQPNALEDFFACTLVVENRTAIIEAKSLVENFCIVLRQKPKREMETHKFPDAFPFDDLRLYVKLKPSDFGPPTPLNEIIFEIQIKTFLQHAWSIATHDLIYKGNSISWSKARLAYQIKAMLEHAEISIEQVEEIAQSSALNVIDPKTSILKDILSWLQTTWAEELLPSNLVRLAETIAEIMNALKFNLDTIKDIISADSLAGAGANSMNMSPYESIIKAIINHRPSELTKFLNQKITSWNKTKIFITAEMEVDSFLDGLPTHRLIFSRPKKINNKFPYYSAFGITPLSFIGVDKETINKDNIRILVEPK